MPDVRLYADESGNFDFRDKPGATQYFVLASIALSEEVDRALAADLRELRFDLVRDGLPLGDQGCFHASEDKQAIRDAVFAVLGNHSFRIDATILEKRKAFPSTRTTDERFYQHAWYFHLKHVGPGVQPVDGNLFISAAAIGTKAKRQQFLSNVDLVAQQLSDVNNLQPTGWDVRAEPCLQAADYCCWAIARKWERGDDRSYRLVENKIASEFDLYSTGSKTFY